MTAVGAMRHRIATMKHEKTYSVHPVGICTGVSWLLESYRPEGSAAVRGASMSGGVGRYVSELWDGDHAGHTAHHLWLWVPLRYVDCEALHVRRMLTKLATCVQVGRKAGAKVD